jgi:membrane-associated phospholipid phosphatase
MDAGDFAAYKRHHLRVRRRSWIAIFFGSMAIGLALCAFWSFVGGVIVLIVLANIGLTLHLRRDKARWIKRFPELADPRTTWRRTF